MHVDGLKLFILFKKANSYLLIKDYGTFYYYNNNSILSNLRKENKINKPTRDCVLYLEFMFHYTNDTLYEKNMAVFQFKSLLNQFGYIYKKVSNGYDYIYKVIDLYLNCKIILEEDKKIILSLKNEIKSKDLNLLLWHYSYFIYIIETLIFINFQFINIFEILLIYKFNQV